MTLEVPEARPTLPPRPEVKPAVPRERSTPPAGAPSPPRLEARDFHLYYGAHHALTIRTDSGLEVLLHIGIDTVMLRGEGFTPLVAMGARVKRGQPLIRFDVDAVAMRARSLLTQVIIANMDAVAGIEPCRGVVAAKGF